jgi:N-methylhydantoinase A
MAWRVGVDIGGTFTDVAMVEEATGRIGIATVLTTPHDFSEAVIDGIRQGLAREKIAPADVSLLAHATTVVTNALLEHKGAKAGLVTTRGFRDVLELRRSSRSDLYDLFQDGPAILVPRRWRYEITERIDAQGAVVTPLAESEIDGVIAAIRDAGLEAVAVSFLFSFLNDRHERIVGERLRKALPKVKIFLSCEVLPEVREFERTSTTAVCAYVAPVLESYLGRLQKAVTELGLPKLYVMGSSGGVFDIAEGLRMPAMAVESGPAAGVIAAALVGRQLGLANVISFDMGGTTAKASLIAEGEVAVTAEYEVGGSGHVNRWQHGSGHPIRVPVIDLAEVSAGGGSIAWVDPGGALKIGPGSAGSTPGPAAYGRGGLAATVSDANVVLGYLNREALLGGDLKIDLGAAEAAIARSVGEPLGLSVPEAAARIIEIVDSNMAEALRIVSIERGHDPREFSLVAFGGAGPIHAASLAGELQIPEVVVPPAPGVFSALGLVATDLRRDYSRTLYADLGAVEPAVIAAAFDAMETEGRSMLTAANVVSERRGLLRFADIRYRRQAYELTVPVADGPVTQETLKGLVAAFHDKHRQTYGHASDKDAVQLVNLRLTAVGRIPGVTLAQRANGTTAGRTGSRDIWFAGEGFVRTPVHWRLGLSAGTAIDGPAVIEAVDSTVLLPPGWQATVDAQGYIRMKRR